MKIVTLITFMLLSVGRLCAQQKTIFPKTTFNAEEAKTMLEQGTSSIEGEAAVNRGLSKYWAKKGTKVVLFPMTPYFKEYLELRKKYKDSSNINVAISNEAYALRLETVTLNIDADFVFEKMKPGEYYLECLITYTGTKYAGKEEVGRTVYTNGGGQIVGYGDTQYRDKTSTYRDSRLETKIVNIKKEGKRIKIKL